MLKRNIVGAILLMLALGSSCLLAQPFFFRKDIPVGVSPRAVIPGDFDGDGRTDLAVDIAEGIVVVLNKGGGTFSPPILTEAPSGWLKKDALSGLFWLGVAADFNGDGKDDLVGSGFLFLSRGDGTFLPPRYIGAQEAVAAGDFNRDGKMDLLIADQDWNSGRPTTRGVRVFLGNGDGTFQFGATITSVFAAQVRVADFNGDGRTDVAVSYIDSTGESTSTSLMVFPGRGDGTFSAGIRTPIAVIGPGTGTPGNASYPWTGPAFLVADFNGDGLADAFAECGIMLGKGDGSFQSPVPYTGEVRGFPLAAADFTGDGYADLVMPYSPRSIATHQGKGDGTFLPPAEQAVGWFPPGLTAVVVDLDGDGRLDVVTPNFPASNNNVVSVLLARTQGGPALRRATSAASDTTIVAPESLATLYAPSAAAAASASPPWSTRLGGISLEVRDSAGATRLAPLLYVSPTQINFQVPAGTALGEAALAIAGDSGAVEAGSMQVDAVAPGVFMAFAGAWIPAATGVLVEPEGAQVPVPVFTCWGLDCGLEPIPLSAAGDRPIYLSFFGTGFHGANPDDVTCSANGLQVPVVYAGPQQTPGVDQINIRLLPKVLETLECDPYWGCSSQVSVTIRINGVPANSFWLWVE